jgi:sec1 family domain-containing protein 1
MPPPSAMRQTNATSSGTSLGGPGALPGSHAPGTGASFGQRRQGFSEAIVFTVGGGSLEEYGNLQEWIARTAGPNAGDRGRKRVVYGSTEMLNAEEFIKRELEKLGSEVGS